MAEVRPSKNHIDVFIPLFSFILVMSCGMSMCVSSFLFRRVFQHTICFPVFAICFLFLTVSSVSTSSLPSLPAYVSLSPLVSQNQLQLWDTAGQERFRKSMVQHYYRNVHAVLFVYDVTCPASFSSLSSWLEECRQNSLGQDIPRWLPQNLSALFLCLDLIMETLPVSLMKLT